jgi:hypothetical protein
MKKIRRSPKHHWLFQSLEGVREVRMMKLMTVVPLRNPTKALVLAKRAQNH